MNSDPVPSHFLTNAGVRNIIDEGEKVLLENNCLIHSEGIEHIIYRANIFASSHRAHVPSLKSSFYLQILT